MASVGPVEYVVIGFPGNRFKGEIVPAVAELLSIAPKLKALVTSRAPLHIYGEHEFLVPSLALPALCVQAGMTPHYRRQVAPFGNPRVKACSAAHRGLSQPSTPFFDSWCQGIHRMPFIS